MVTTAPSFKPTRWRTDEADAEKYRFSSDEVLNAYLKGHDEGRGFAARAALEKFDRNFAEAAEALEGVYAEILRQGLHPHSARLRVDAADRFTGLFILSEDEYFSDAADEVYRFTIRLKKALDQAGDLHLATVLTHDTHLDERLLLSDGFAFRYAPEA